MSRRTRSARRQVEDATSLGGWLFADSFLALMVIFLATISFVPNLGGSTPPDQAVGSAGNYKNAFVMVFENYNRTLLETELKKFFTSEELPAGTKVLYAEILGGYDPATEAEYDGNLRGLTYAVALKQDALPVFSSATINVGASSSIEPNQILVRLTLARL
jgi:hypothetical protein